MIIKTISANHNLNITKITRDYNVKYNALHRHIKEEKNRRKEKKNQMLLSIKKEKELIR